MILTDEGGKFLRTVRYYDGFESRLGGRGPDTKPVACRSVARASDPRRRLANAAGRGRATSSGNRVADGPGV